MGVWECFSAWFTIPSEQGCSGCTDRPRTSRCKTPHNWRAFLPPTDFVSPYRQLGQGQHNSELLHSWYLCLVLVTWWDSTGTDGLYHHWRAGRAMPGLFLLLWWILTLICTDPDTFCWSTTNLVSKLHSVWPCVHSMHSWKECLGCRKGPTNIFRMHTYLPKMPTNYISIS